MSLSSVISCGGSCFFCVCLVFFGRFNGLFPFLRLGPATSRAHRSTSSLQTSVETGGAGFVGWKRKETTRVSAGGGSF